MAPRTSHLGLTLIEAFESNKLKGYLCPAGIPTIGRGITTAALQAAGEMIRYANGKALNEVKIGWTISRAESDRLYAAVIDHFENKVEALVRGVQLTQAQFDALVSFAWNAGYGALEKSTLLKRVKRHEFDRVPAEFMKWTKAKVDGVRKEMKGLVRRRRAEAALWRGDLEDAESYLGMKFGPMPQAVDEPKPPKRMDESKIGNGAILGGGAGSAGPVIEAAQEAREAIEQGKDLFETALSVGPWVILALVVVAIALYIWRERRRKLIEDEV